MSTDTGQVVAAGSASGSIYDLGYRHYSGPRLGRPHAIRSLVRHSFRLAYGIGRSGRAKIIPIGLAVLATIPAVVALGVTALATQLGAGEDLEAASPVRYDTYYPVVAQTVALFAAAQAPELLGRDLRYRVLTLYFTRALRRDDYALGKLGAMVLAMLVLLLVPFTLIFVGRALVSPDIPAAVGEDLPEIGPALAISLLTAGLLGALGLAIASFSPRRAYATIGIIAVLVVPPIVVEVAQEIAGDDVSSPLTLLSPPDILIGANDFLFGTGNGQGNIPDWVYPLAAIAWTVVLAGTLVWRYRRIEP
jgi:ABC-2 type transport system permease protein